MCKLVNSAVLGTIDESKINRKANLNIFQKTENVNIAIAGAKKIGCILVNMNPQLIFDKREHIILGFIWQLMRIKYVSKVNVKEMPTLMALKENNEKESDFVKATPEQLLLRWFNHHLNNSSYPLRVTNFSSDLKTGLAYMYLLNQLMPKTSDLSGVNMEIEQRVDKVVTDAKNMGINEPMTCNDIISGNSKLNLLFCASIFKKYPELKPPREVIKQEIEDSPPVLITIDNQESIELPPQSQEMKESQVVNEEPPENKEVFEPVNVEEKLEQKLTTDEPKFEQKIELKQANTILIDEEEIQKIQDEEDKKKIEGLISSRENVGSEEKSGSEEKELLVKDNSQEEKKKKEKVKKLAKPQQQKDRGKKNVEKIQMEHQLLFPLHYLFYFVILLLHANFRRRKKYNDQYCFWRVGISFFRNSMLSLQQNKK